MTRLRAPLLAGLGASAAGAVAVGDPALVGGGALVAAVVAVALSPRRAPHQVVEAAWSARPPTTMSGAPQPSSRRRTVRTLGRVEARELATNPWFGAGVGVSAVSLITFVLTVEDPEATWSELVGLMPFLAHPLVGLTVVASHRVTTRSWRDGTDELFAACPVAPAARRAGAVSAAWVPVVALAVFFATYLGLTEIRNPGEQGDLGSVTVAVSDLVAGVGLGAGGVALGVALGRWARFALAPVLAVIAVGFVSLELGKGETGQYRPRMLLSTFGTSLPEDAPEITAGQGWLHVAWLGSITVLTAVVAVARRDEDRPVPPARPSGAAP